MGRQTVGPDLDVPVLEVSPAVQALWRVRLVLVLFALVVLGVTLSYQLVIYPRSVPRRIRFPRLQCFFILFPHYDSEA
jgi:hypothetical protein